MKNKFVAALSCARSAKRSARRSACVMAMATSLGASLGLSLGTSAAHGSLIVNGSFEEPAITAAFIVLPAGSTTVTGWVVTAPAPTWGVDLVSRAAGDDYVYDGNQSIDLAGTPGRGSISQQVPTNLGEIYELRFFLSSNGGSMVDGVTVLWNDEEIATYTSPAYGFWSEFVLNVTGIAGTSSLTFRGNVDGVAGTMLDLVSLNVVPAPGATALAIGAMAMGLRRRRR